MALDRMGVFVVAVLMMTLGSSMAIAGDWEHVATEDGVWIYEREVGDDVAFRGVIEVDMHIGKIVSVLVDPDQRPHWVNRYADHETLEHTGNTEVYWIQFDMPFGVTDRDYVLRAEGQTHESNRTFIQTTTSVEHERKPEQDCCVRAETETRYVLQATPGEEKTTVSVEVQTDFKGRVPGRVVNQAQRDWPVATLTGLVERARASGIEVDPRVRDWHEE